jgi:hypothetical protein
MKYISSIVTSAITALIILAGGFFSIFFLMIAMNGFSEKQANPVFITHIVLTFVCSIAFGLMGIWFKNFLVKRSKMHIALAATLAILCASVIGIFVNIFGSLAVMAIASEAISR